MHFFPEILWRKSCLVSGVLEKVCSYDDTMTTQGVISPIVIYNKMAPFQARHSVPRNFLFIYHIRTELFYPLSQSGQIALA